MTSTDQPRAPGDPIRWGILGSGRIAAEFAQGLVQAEGAVLAAVGSRAKGSAERFAAAHGALRAHGSYADLVADHAVDAVYVATPHVRHRDDCLLVIEAGKAVLCEKPFTIDAAQAEEVAAAARAKGVFCMEAMWMRFIPAVRRALELVQEGAIGELRMLTADFGAPTPEEPGDRFYDPELGGGALLDRGVYPVALAHALFGAPTAVHAAMAMTATGVDEHGGVLLQHEGGAIAALTSTLSGYASNAAVLVGTRGRIVLPEPFCRPDRLLLRLAPKSGGGSGGGGNPLVAALKNNAAVRKLHRRLRGEADAIQAPYRGNGFCHEAEEVGRCLRAGMTESDVIPLDDSVAVMRTLDRIRGEWGA